MTSLVTLQDREQPVSLSALRAAHTHGDLLVELPQAKVVHAGGLLFRDRHPYARDADLGGWLSTLNRLARMEERMAQGDRTGTEAWKQYDWQFHQALISACGSKMLIDTHAAVFDKYLRYQMIALSYRGEIAAREHALLLECAMQRDSARACEVLTRHVAGGVEHALATGTIS